MVLLRCHLVLLYLIHVFLILVQSSPERFIRSMYFLSIRYFKGIRDLLKQVVTFDGVKNILRDHRSKDYEQMSPKASRNTLHRTPNGALHFALEIFNIILLLLFHMISLFSHTGNVVPCIRKITKS